MVQEFQPHPIASIIQEVMEKGPDVLFKGPQQARKYLLVQVEYFCRQCGDIKHSALRTCPFVTL